MWFILQAEGQRSVHVIHRNKHSGWYKLFKSFWRDSFVWQLCNSLKEGIKQDRRNHHTAFVIFLDQLKRKLFHAAFCWVKLRTHLTPKRSMNMMWFLNVLLTSKSICLISVEKLRACCFIFCTRKRTNVLKKNVSKTSQNWHILKKVSRLIPHICPRFLVWLSLCPEARPRPGLSAAEGCLYTHASPTEMHVIGTYELTWLSKHKETLHYNNQSKEAEGHV